MVDPTDKILQLVKANSHPLKVKMAALFRIYGPLSTSELVEKTGKSKPTVLKHLDELQDLDMVTYDTEVSPGAYNKRIYRHTQPSWLIQGQKLRERVRKQPELVLLYANYQLAVRTQLKEIIDLSVSYQQRMNQELEALVGEGGPDLGDRVLDIMQDQLGHFSTTYTSEHAETGKGEKDVRDFLRIELFLPIRRIIEQMSRDEWQVDGTIWRHFQ